MSPNIRSWTKGGTPALATLSSMFVVGTVSATDVRDLPRSFGEEQQAAFAKSFLPGWQVESEVQGATAFPTNVLIRSATEVDVGAFERLALDIAARQTRLPEDVERLIADNLLFLYG